MSDKRRADRTAAIWHVLRGGDEKFRGTEPECFRFIVFGQGQSVDYATKHGGWTLEPVPEEPA
jgi:hypothetical protein